MTRLAAAMKPKAPRILTPRRAQPLRPPRRVGRSGVMVRVESGRSGWLSTDVMLMEKRSCFGKYDAPTEW
jgi:hypothetical protein